jgi:DNA replication and repair protein RecF
MGVLWLKLGELAYMESVSEQRPVLLLDDIFSELDHAHRDLVVELIRQQQTILTAADEHLVEGVGGGVVKL